MFTEDCTHDDCERTFESNGEQTAYQKRRLHEIDAHGLH